MKLKYKIVTYSPEGLDEELLDKEKYGVKYLSKKAFDKAAEDGLEYRIVGKTRLKEAEKDDEKVLNVGEKRYLLEECRLTRLVGYIPVGYGGFVEYRQTLIPIIILLFLLLAAGIGLLAFLLKPEPIPVLQPDYELAEIDQNQTPNSETVNGNTLIIMLPEGDLELKDPILTFWNEKLRSNEQEYSEDCFFGTQSMKIYMTKDEQEYLIFDDRVTLSDGALQEVFLDYLIQKTELVNGVYDGRIELDYGSLGILKEPLTVVISSRRGGTMEIGFSEYADVDRKTGEVTFLFSSGVTASHETILQLILDKNGEEYLLAQSGIIEVNSTLTRMELIEGAAERLTPGGYTGRLRLNFYNKERNEADTDLNTDINIKIRIH